MQNVLKDLFSDHYKDVYSYLYSLSRDASLSEDLASEVFLETVKSIARFRGESDIKTWLFTIARRRWFAWLRRQKRQVQTEALSEFCESPGQGPAEEAVNRALAERIHALLSAEP